VLLPAVVVVAAGKILGKLLGGRFFLSPLWSGLLRQGYEE